MAFYMFRYDVVINAPWQYMNAAMLLEQKKHTTYHIELNSMIAFWDLGVFLAKTQVSNDGQILFRNLPSKPTYVSSQYSLFAVESVEYRLGYPHTVRLVPGAMGAPPPLSQLSSIRQRPRLPLSSAARQLWCCHCSASLHNFFNCHTLLGNFPWQTFVLFKSLCRTHVGVGASQGWH